MSTLQLETSPESICALASKSLTFPGATVEILRPADLERTTNVVISTFLSREPVCRLLRSWHPSAEQSIIAWIRDACTKAADSGLSVVLKVFGEIAYAQIVLPYEPKESGDAMDLPGAEPMVDMLDQLSVLYNQSPVPTGRTAELVCAATAKEWQGRDFAAVIVQVVAAVAKSRGFDGIMTKASSHSQQILERLGLQAVGEVKYKEYTWKGEKVFGRIESPKSCNVMWARVGDVKDSRGKVKL